MELLDIFKRVELFRGLSDAQLMRLAEISQQEAYDSQDIICHQGDPGDRMFVVANGQVEIRVRDVHGTTHAAVFLGEGQIIGEMALIDAGPRSATVIAATEDTVVFSIPNTDFVSLCQADTAIGYVMMRNIAQDLSFKLRHRDADF
jgi:CRP-like cAMP-binding protein